MAKGHIGNNLPPCPFVAGPKVEDTRLFIGRKEELRIIRDRMTGAQPTSLNFYGERRVGKSSLLYHFFQTCAEDPKRYVIIYLSLQDAACKTQAGFYRALADALAGRVSDQALAEPMRAAPMDAVNFREAIRSWKQQGVLAVICLDEFEALMAHPDQFNNDFFDHLRSLMDANALMLVIASREKLSVYRKRHMLTSRFFNLGHAHELSRLTPGEAEALVSLPAGVVPGAQPALKEEDRRRALAWGERHPYLLQLACLALCEARLSGRDADWARRRFEEQYAHWRETAQPPTRQWSQLLRALCLAPAHIGSLARRIGTQVDQYVAWAIGAIIVIVVALAALGQVDWLALWEIIKLRLGLG